MNVLEPDCFMFVGKSASNLANGIVTIERSTISRDSLAIATNSGDTLKPNSGAISMARLNFNARIHSGG